MDLDALEPAEKLAAAGGVLAVVGFVLPWFRIFGRPRSGVEMIVGSPSLARHATPALQMMWATILGVILLALLAGIVLTIAPARGKDPRPLWTLAAGGVALGVTLLILVVALQMGIGYWATLAGGLGLVGGNLRARGVI